MEEKKKDHVKVIGDHRFVDFGNEYENIIFRLGLPKDKYNDEEADEFGEFVMRAIVAYLGIQRHEDQIMELVNSTSIGMQKKVGSEFLKKAKEALAWGYGLIFGFDQYEKDYTRALEMNTYRDKRPGDDGDPAFIMPEVHIGDPKKVH